MPNRTPADYAIEHAEFMASTAEALLLAVNHLAALTLQHEESDDLDEETIYDARCDVSEYARALKNRIYEFRKRRDRALTAKGEPS